MKRVITYVVLIVLCYVLQVSVFSYFKMAGIIPNIMLILVVSFSLMRGQTEGMLLGFFAGLVVDIMGGQDLVLYALIFTCMGYGNGFFNQIFYANNILLPLAMILGNSIAYNFVMYVCGFLLRNRTDFLFYLIHVMLPEVVYTFFVALFLYNLFLYINNKLEDYTKRSA